MACRWVPLGAVGALHSDYHSWLGYQRPLSAPAAPSVSTGRGRVVGAFAPTSPHEHSGWGAMGAGAVAVSLAPLDVPLRVSRARWYCLSGRLVGLELPNFPSHLQSAVCPPLLGGDEWSYYICTILSCPPAKLSGELNVAGEGE